MSSYIGNADPKLIFPDNTRDDLIPDPGTSKVIFELSQEVPGGYENNVVVFRKKHQFTTVVLDEERIGFDATNESIYTDDDSVIAALLDIQVGDLLSVTGSASNDNTSSNYYKVDTITYDPLASPKFELFLQSGYGIINEAIGAPVTIKVSKDGSWEILEPEVDYTINGTGVQKNRLITLSEVLQLEDVAYVLHRGSATYNFVPTNNSVTPDKLSQNLRNFVADRWEQAVDTTSGETDFPLSQLVINNRTIIVTVDGAVLDGDDPMAGTTGDWELIDPTASNPPEYQTLRFHVAPADNAKIRILHLGFSTVSRRSSLSDGQIAAIPAGSVDTIHLANNSVTGSKLDIDSVSNQHLTDNSVTGVEILLENNEALRSKDNVATIKELLKLNASNETELKNDTLIKLLIAGVGKLLADSTSVYPEVTGTVDLGKITNKWEDAYFNGTIDSVNVDTDSLTVNDNEFNGINIVTLESRVTANENSFSTKLPSGAMMMFAADGNTTEVHDGTLPQVAEWLYCRGQLVSKTTYADLYAALGSGTIYGESGGNFYLPDMRQRFPLGKAGGSGQGNVIGQSGGVSVTGTSASIGHTHTFAHTHNTSSSGTLPNHYHTVTGGTGSAQINATHSHTHPMSHTHGMNHYHPFDHNHAIDGHTHHDFSNFYVIDSASFNLPVHRINYQDINNPTPGAVGSGFRWVGSGAHGYFDYQHGHGGYIGNSADISRNGDDPIVTALASQTTNASRGWGPATYGPNGASDAVGYLTLGPKGTRTVGAGDKLTTDGASISNTGNPSTATVSISGETGLPTSLPSIASTGSTTSQSSSTTSEGTPAYRVVNYIVKT